MIKLFSLYILLASNFSFSQNYNNMEKSLISTDTKNNIVEEINTKRANLRSFMNCVLRAQTKLDVKTCDEINSNATHKLSIDKHLR